MEEDLDVGAEGAVLGICVTHVYLWVFPRGLLKKHTLMCRNSHKLEDCPYDPYKLAELLQFCKWDNTKGCPFTDDVWTLNMRLVRGLSLYKAIMPVQSPDPAVCYNQLIERRMVNSRR
jgi:hypothetical protein